MKKQKGFDQFKYQNEYNKEKYDRLTLVMPKGKKDKVKQRAVELNKSVNSYINDVLDKDINKRIMK